MKTKVVREGWLLQIEYIEDSPSAISQRDAVKEAIDKLLMEIPSKDLYTTDFGYFFTDDITEEYKEILQENENVN